MEATYTHNTEFNGIEITFDGCPPVEIREDLKACGFRWHRKKKLWYAKQTVEREIFAQKMCGGKYVKTPKQTSTNKWGVKVGDIFHGSWGYDQTNNTFFQVVALAGKSSVRVVEVCPAITDRKATCGMAEDRTYKITGDLLPPVPSIFIKDEEHGDLKRLKDYNGDIPYIMFGSMKGMATLVTGDTLTAYESWYA